MTYRLAPHHGLALIATLLLASQAAAQTYVYRTTADNSPLFAPAPDGGEGAGPDAAPAADCYAPENIGQVAQAGWSVCGGMLIVDNAMLRAAGSPNVGGNGSFAITGPDGNTYTFADGVRTVYTGQVTDLIDLFHSTDFNGDVGHWDTGNVTRMTGAFGYTTAFNQDLSGWDLNGVTSTAYMFYGAYVFNGDISGWDLSTVTEAQYMFSYAYNFNRDISAWDVSSVTNMAYMFLSASAFSQDLGAWDVGNVSNMFSMFRFAAQFNADLSGWCVSRIATKPLNFDGGATAWTLPKPVWGTCPGA